MNHDCQKIHRLQDGFRMNLLLGKSQFIANDVHKSLNENIGL